MKHASPEILSAHAALLDRLRALGDLKERKTGVFYRKSKAFLHFHEEAGKLYADVRLSGPDFDRWPATSRAEQQRLVTAVRDWLVKARSSAGG